MIDARFFMGKPFLKKNTIFPQIVKKTGHLSLSDSVEETCVQGRTGGNAGEMVKEALKDKDPIPSVRVIYNEDG